MKEPENRYLYGTGENEYYKEIMKKALEYKFSHHHLNQPLEFSHASSTFPEGFDRVISLEREPDRPSIEMKYDYFTKYNINDQLKAELNEIERDIEALKDEIIKQKKEKEEKNNQPFHFNPEDLDV